MRPRNSDVDRPDNLYECEQPWNIPSNQHALNMLEHIPTTEGRCRGGLGRAVKTRPGAARATDTPCCGRDGRPPSGTRRVRKLGRVGFAGESCRRTGAWLADRWGAVTLATDAPPFALMILSGRRDSPKGLAREEVSTCSAKNPAATGKSRRITGKRSTHPLESLSFVRRNGKRRRKPRRPRAQDFPGNPPRPSLRTLRGRASFGPDQHLPRQTLWLRSVAGLLPAPCRVSVPLRKGLRVPLRYRKMADGTHPARRAGWAHRPRIERIKRRVDRDDTILEVGLGPWRRARCGYRPRGRCPCVDWRGSVTVAYARCVWVPRTRFGVYRSSRQRCWGSCTRRQQNSFLVALCCLTRAREYQITPNLAKGGPASSVVHGASWLLTTFRPRSGRRVRLATRRARTRAAVRRAGRDGGGDRVGAIVRSAPVRLPAAVSRAELLVERPVWPVRVVVKRVDTNHALEMAAADDQQPVEALAAHASHPALGVRPRPWRPHRRLDDMDAFGAEDLVEVARELAVAIANQEADAYTLVVEAHDQVARLLCHPSAIGLCRDASEMDAPALKLDEKQDVEALQEHRVDGEEVTLQDARRLPAQELSPAGVESPRRRLDPLAPEDFPDRAGRDPDAEPDQLALDAAVSPAWILARQAHNQLTHRGSRLGTTGAPMRIRPAARHQLPVPP